MGVAVVRVMLNFGLVLLILSLFAVVFVPADSPGFVAAVMAVAVNLVTVVGSWVVLRKLLARKRG